MKCPFCQSETQKGELKAFGSSPLSVSVVYYPEEEKGKLFKQTIVLKNKAESYYCEHCHKVFACIDEK